MAVEISSAFALTGVFAPKKDFRAIPARGPAKPHLERYGVSYWSPRDEPFKYYTIEIVLHRLEETGVLARLDQLCFMALDEAGSLLNWVALGVEPTNNGMPLGPLGFEGDGASVFIDTGFNPSTAVDPKYTLNSAHFGVYISDNAGAANTTNMALGQMSGTQYASLWPKSNSTSSAYRINSTTSQAAAHPYYGNNGFLLVNRAGANTTRLLHDGKLVASAGANAATGVPNGKISIARHGSNYGGGKYAGWSIGGGLSTSADQNQEVVLSECMWMLARTMGAA